MPLLADLFIFYVSLLIAGWAFLFNRAKYNGKHIQKWKQNKDAFIKYGMVLVFTYIAGLNYALFRGYF